MIEVTQKQWDAIHADYKGVWFDYYGDHPEWIGRRVVMSGCITNDPTELGKLLIAGEHFVIVEE